MMKWQALLEGKGKYALVAGLVALVAIGGYLYHDYRESVRASSQLTLHGNVNVREVALAFRGSDRVAELLVDAGDTVKAGQVLARLDKRDLELQRAELKGRIAAQESVVERLQNGSRQEDTAQLAAQVNSSRANLEYANLELQRLQNAYDESNGGAISAQALDAARARAKVAVANVAQAEQAYAKSVHGARPEELKEGAANLEVLKSTLARQDYLLSQMELIAPANGVIRSRLLEVGDMASPQTPVFKMALEDKKWVRVYVNEKDLGRVYEGLKAEITIDGQESKKLQGQVGYIGSVAEFTPKTVQTDEVRTTLVYEVRVYVQDEDNILRMGMPATVTLKF